MIKALADAIREENMSDRQMTPIEKAVEYSGYESKEPLNGLNLMARDQYVGYLAGHAAGHAEGEIKGRREALEMAQGLVGALKEAKAWLDTPIGNAKSDDQSAYETIVEALAKFEAWREGK